MIARRLLSAIAIAVLALPVFADNTVIPPQRTRMLVVDGKDAKSIDNDAKSGITMNDGRHQLVFQIRTLVRDGNDNRLFTSSPYIMTFDTKGNETYTIQGPDLRNTRDVSQFERAPAERFSLTTGKDENVSFEFRPYHKSGLLLGNIVDDIQKFNMTDDPAAVKEFAGSLYVAAAATTTATATTQPAVAETVMAPIAPPKPAPTEVVPASESMLKYWWNQSDEVTRNKFLQWIAEER